MAQADRKGLEAKFRVADLLVSFDANMALWRRTFGELRACSASSDRSRVSRLQARCGELLKRCADIGAEIAAEVAKQRGQLDGEV